MLPHNCSACQATRQTCSTWSGRGTRYAVCYWMQPRPSMPLGIGTFVCLTSSKMVCACVKSLSGTVMIGNACPAVCLVSANDDVAERNVVVVPVVACHAFGGDPQLAVHLRNIRVTRLIYGHVRKNTCSAISELHDSRCANDVRVKRTACHCCRV